MSNQTLWRTFVALDWLISGDIWNDPGGVIVTITVTIGKRQACVIGTGAGLKDFADMMNN